MVSSASFGPRPSISIRRLIRSPKGAPDEQADHRDAGRFEDGIGTPPHNNAGIFLGKFQDHLALHLKQDVLRRLALPHLRSALIDAGKEPGIGCFFLSARKQFLPQFRFLCGQSDQFPVIAPDVQFLCQPFSNLPGRPLPN